MNLPTIHVCPRGLPAPTRASSGRLKTLSERTAPDSEAPPSFSQDLSPAAIILLSDGGQNSVRADALQNGDPRQAEKARIRPARITLEIRIESPDAVWDRYNRHSGGTNLARRIC